MLDNKNLPMIKIITKHLIKINKNADINLKYKAPVYIVIISIKNLDNIGGHIYG